MCEAIRFFQVIPITEFLFGLKWSPQMAIRADQVGSSGAFGAVPLFAGTLLISCIAMVVAVPIGLMSAIYLSEYAGPHLRASAKPLLEILAGIPTVVYGFFAALIVAPFIRDSGSLLGLDVASESALAAGLVMGIMIIPFVSSLSDDIINRRGDGRFTISHPAKVSWPLSADELEVELQDYSSGGMKVRSCIPIPANVRLRFRFQSSGQEVIVEKIM